jgi:hypothetical protein
LFECLYGYTPFACEDRHNTKLKILKHKQTLVVPQVDPPQQPSKEAIDLMLQLMVEKEKRLCSRRYQLNDYTTQIVGGRQVKMQADKTHRDYQGYFVYGHDAEDLKRHPFFKFVPWQNMHEKRPPFVPRVQHWEDTKYFDDDQPISDIDGGPSPSHVSDAIPENGLISLSARAPDSKASQHHQEDQHIVSSLAMKPCGTAVLPKHTTVAKSDGLDGQHENCEQICVPPPNTEIKPQYVRERKRARDKILRDPAVCRIAMACRKKAAFMGYSYRRPKAVQEILDEAIEAEFPGWLEDAKSPSGFQSPLAEHLRYSPGLSSQGSRPMVV